MVILFLGAGFSKAIYEVPLMTELYMSFGNHLGERGNEEEREVYENIVEILDRSYKEVGKKLDIEAILTVLDDLSRSNPTQTFLHPTLLYLFEIGGVSLDKISTIKFGEDKIKTYKNIKEEFTKYIIDLCDVRDKEGKVGVLDDFFDHLVGGNFKKFIMQRRGEKEQKTFNINQPLHIFTTNYDTCLEKYFGEGKVGYETGVTFTWDKKKIVNIRDSPGNPLYYYPSDSQNIKIFKLHGSITWRRMGDGLFYEIDPKFPKEKLTVHGESIGDLLMVYPIIGKERFREPFSDAFVHLRKRILEDQNLIVVGYSWRDDEIKDLIIDAVKRKREQRGKFNVILIDPSAQEHESMLDIKSFVINRDFNLGIIDKLNIGMQKT